MKKITINNSILKGVLKHMKDIIATQTSLEVLKNILFEVKAGNIVNLTVTDLEVVIVNGIPCTNESLDAFSFLLPFNLLFKFSELAGDIPLTIETDTNSAVIRGINDKFSINSLDKVAEFPKTPVFADRETNLITVDKSFIHFMSKAAESVSKDTLRPAMTKVLLEIESDGVNIVSTDARCLFRKTIALSSKSTAMLLVGKKVVKALSNFAETEVFWNTHHIGFKSDNVMIITRNADEKFPAYKNIIPQDSKPNVEFDYNELAVTLEKAKITSDLTTTRVSFGLKEKEGIVVISSNDVDQSLSSRIEIEAEYTGSVDAAHVSAKILLKVLGQVAFDKISFSIMSPTRAILLTSPEDAGYLGLIMPLMMA